MSRVRAEGKKPSWTALLAAASAMAVEQQWNRFAQVVEWAREFGSPDAHSHPRSQERLFWQLVKNVASQLRDR